MLHPVTWANDILRADVCTDKDRNLFIIGMYSLWMQRNKRKHGEQQTLLSSAVKWSIDMAFDLWELSRPKKGALTTSKKRWQPPPMGWIKCNIDGAFDPTQV
jgi:hypothetical protein